MSSTTPWLPDEHNVPDTLAPFTFTVTCRPMSRRSSFIEYRMLPLVAYVVDTVVRLAHSTTVHARSRENASC